MNKTIATNMIETDDDLDIVTPQSDDLAPITLQLTEDVAGMRLDKVLSDLLPQYSRSRLQQWISSGNIKVNDLPAKAKMSVIGDEKILVVPQTSPEEHAFEPENIPLNIVYEDNTILIVDKPAGLVVHPAAGNWSGTLLNGLLHYCPALTMVPRAGIVHRLDKETSGLMVVAKTLSAQTHLVRQLQARTVKRQYLALVWGEVPYEGTIDEAMARHPKDRLKMAVSRSLTAKPAITHFHRKATGELDGKAVSLVLCQLETGRTHQIRVHMQSIGYPLVGDPLYGKKHLMSYFPRQALQAYRLGLVHPVTDKHVEWQIHLAEDFQELLERAGIDIDRVTI